MSSLPEPSGARRIPSVDRLLAVAEVQALCERYGRRHTVAALREELTALRERLRNGEAFDPARDVTRLASRLRSTLDARRQSSLVPVINATGVVLHTNLGRAPLAPAALRAVLAVAGRYSNLEYELEEGARGSRTSHVEPLLRRLTGAEAALVVNNGAAAALLALAALGSGREVIASRGELVEIGGAFRVPEVVAQSGAVLVEVGTTNRTRVGDYERAITAQTRVLLKTHPSNYRIVGFAEAPGRRELAALAHARGLLLVEDLGSGSLVALASCGLPDEPTVGECIAQGSDVVTFSGDKLLGGPQAGIAVGTRACIEAMGRHPLARALRADKMTLAALEATLRLYDEGRALEEVPALRMLAATSAQVRRRAARVAAALSGTKGLRCDIVEEESLPGGGALPLSTLPSVAVRLTVPGRSAREMARACLAQRPPVAGRIHRDAFLLDMRTVAAAEVAALVASIRGALP
ncbi:MAG TPA: L-seryl-tRNA(Sec) selenium transferase [Usitatibacter sp.]|nr:L-seryl-tRNA(Sec) selenium transferase [Usitatibacter sp.]